jgi:hypothetical protein
MPDKIENTSWSSAWPDLIAFVGWLAIARWGRWQTSDLVWSLWLSSLVVGYTMILWAMCRPVADIIGAAAGDRSIALMLAGTSPAKLAMMGSVALFGWLFVLAFFTVHFGGFHYVHSQFLESFFPVDMGYSGHAHPGQLEIYKEVVRRYWIILPSAFLSHRAAFMRRPTAPEPYPPVTADAIAVRKLTNALQTPGMMMMEPYINVIRMHLLIFFFAVASFAKWDNFAVFAVVYAVYFFPWRLVRSGVREPAPA